MRILSSSGLNVGLCLYQARRWTLAALLPALLVAGGAYVFTKHQPKTYQASAVLYVQQAQNTASIGVSGGTDPSASSALAQTYSQMITDATIQAAVKSEMIRKYHRPATWSVQSDQHGITGQTSQLFGVTVTDTIAGRAADVANAYGKVFIQRISKIERARYSADELRLKRQVNGAGAEIKKLTSEIQTYRGPSSGLDALQTSLGAYESTYQSLLSSLESFQASRDANTNSVSVYSAAVVPKQPSGPNSARNGLLFGFVALLLCVGLVFLYDYVNDLPRNAEDVEQAAGVPILGTVQAFSAEEKGSLIVEHHPRSPAAEAYRLIRTNLQFVNVDHPARSLLVTSALPGEGKTTTAGNLGHVFAEGGQGVALVDADLRRPGLHRLFGLTGGKAEGLTTMLSVEQLNGHGVHPTKLDNLLVVTSGPIPPNPTDLLGSKRMRAALEHLRPQDGLVLLDSPPALAVADAAVLASSVDGVVLVVDPHRTKRREIRQARETIDGAGGKLLGVVMNRLRPRGAIYYEQYGYYAYKGGYKYTYGDEKAAPPAPVGGSV